MKGAFDGWRCSRSARKAAAADAYITVHIIDQAGRPYHIMQIPVIFHELQDCRS